MLSQSKRVSLGFFPTPWQEAKKAMAGLIDLIRNGRFQAGDNILFLHTAEHRNYFRCSSL